MRWHFLGEKKWFIMALRVEYFHYKNQPIVLSEPEKSEHPTS